MNLGLWRDIAVILLAMELMVLVAPVLALAYLSVRGVLRLTHFIRGLFPQAHGYAFRLQRLTARMAGAMVAPLISIYSFAAGGKAVARAMWSVLRGGPDEG
jgi:hypothetical protein